MIDFTLPELGEQIAGGDVLRVLVNAGDTIAKEQPILELETDKATIEVPSSVAGVVKDVKVKAGDKVKVGQAILSIDDGVAATSSKSDAVPPKQPERKPEPAKADDIQPDVQGQDRSTRPDKAGEKDDEPVTETPSRGQKVVDISRGARPAEPAAAPEAVPAPAAPSVRRLARELGVEIDQVPGSGASGRISVEDVKEHAKRLVAGAARGGGAAAVPLPDFSRWGPVERQPMERARPSRLSTPITHLPSATI